MAASPWGTSYIRLSDYAVLAVVFSFKDAIEAKKFFEGQQRKQDERRRGKLVKTY